MKKESQVFTDETIESLMELGEVLRSIRARLLSEGYVIKNGRITRQEEYPITVGKV